MDSNGYVISKCEGGFVVRPVEALDNRRWYFDSRLTAHEWVEYLYRKELSEQVVGWEKRI